MGKITGFKENARLTPRVRSVSERIKDWKEVYLKWDAKNASAQASRCMDCGIPFCNNGCPLGNLIPEWNDLVYNQDWHEAINRLHATNNFPEFTGRICPAPCESSCTLAINDDAVTIEMIEKFIADRAWDEGWILPLRPKVRTGKRVGVVGSGAAGLAAAQQLTRAGHDVTVFERNEYMGGLLQLGIPEFKLEKRIVDRRIRQMEQEGTIFKASVNVGADMPAEVLLESFDAVCLATGSTVPRELPIEGRDLDGVHFAMDYLTQQNRRLKGQQFTDEETITAKGKHVIIIGGGDTGADCLGTAHRQGALSVVQMEILPRPPKQRSPHNPWPQWPLIYRTSYAHEEGGSREYSVTTKRFVGGKDKRLKELHCARVEMPTYSDDGRMVMRDVPDSEFILKADLVLLAMGFLHTQHTGLLDSLGLEYDERGNIKITGSSQTSLKKVFACGDAERGQSLIVHAIASGRSCARDIDMFLMGSSTLPATHAYTRSVISNTYAAKFV